MLAISIMNFAKVGVVYELGYARNNRFFSCYLLCALLYAASIAWRADGYFWAYWDGHTWLF